MKTIETKTAKNGVKMFYLDGKRISRDKAIEISKNADNEMLTNALGANVELKDAQAILIIETKDPLEVGKYREFGWCFTNAVDAVEAAKKVAALFGDRFIKAEVIGDAEHFDNKIVATVDKAGNVEIKKQIPTYIFTTYQTVTGVDSNGRTEHVESFATYCKEIGDDDNFTGLYRAVTFYEDRHYDGWDIKTADGKLIAKGNTEAELKKAYEAIKAGNVEVSEETADAKPVWEDPHKYETVGNLEHVRNLTPEWRIYRTEDDDLVEKLTLNGEELTFINGAPNHIHSDTYKAGFSYFSCKFYSTDKEYKTIHEEEEFFAIMAERGACTLDDVYKPTRPLVKTLYFDGGCWDLVTLEQEIVNHETLLFDKDDLLIIRGHHGAKIMFLPNGEIAFFLQPFDPVTHRYIDNFDRVDEDEFWLEMTERGLCTLEPVNNELVVADYEYTDKYNEFDEDCRRFLVNGEIITFSHGRWLEIYSPKICAKISRTMYLDTIRYDVDQWIYHKGRNTQLELAKNNISPAEFWAIMLRRGFMKRTEPFIVEINHCDEPPTFYKFMTLNVDYISAGNEKYHVCIFNHVPEIRIGTYTLSKIRTVINRINLAFANDAGITVDTNGEVAGVADYDVFTLDTCAEINRHAPEGWTITFDTKGKFFPVKFNGKTVTKLDSLATQKFLSPEKFFEQFKPLVDKTFTPKQQFLADRYNELAELEEMREEIADDAEQLQTLEEMIEQVKRDIAAEELAG